MLIRGERDAAGSADATAVLSLQPVRAASDGLRGEGQPDPADGEGNGADEGEPRDTAADGGDEGEGQPQEEPGLEAGEGAARGMASDPSVPRSPSAVSQLTVALRARSDSAA